MNTTHDDNTTTWRDLADQLTPQQIADLQGQERRGADCSPDAYREWLIGEARDYIADNARDADLNARIRPPAGATSVQDWGSIEHHTPGAGAGRSSGPPTRPVPPRSTSTAGRTRPALSTVRTCRCTGWRAAASSRLLMRVGWLGHSSQRPMRWTGSTRSDKGG